MEGVSFDSPGNDVCGIDTDNLRCKTLHDLLTSDRYNFCSPAYLYSAWLPRWEYVIHDKRSTTVPCGIAVLFRVGDVQPTNINRVQFGVMTETDWNNMRITRCVDGCQPAEALALQVFNLFCCKVAHLFSLNFL